jgi:UDP-N-acetylglucosamine 1-carboxyvinyltransferase
MPESVGNRLRRARKHRGLTQDALANLAGVDQTAISKQENGKMNMEGPTLMRVAGAA